MRTRRKSGTFVWIVVALAAACESAPTAPSTDEPLTVVRLRPEPASFTYTSGLTQPQQLVVRDRNTWQQIWEAIWRNHSPQPAIAEIDFGREMIVVAALGTRPTGGYSVFIDSASAGSEGITIRIRAVSPGGGCVVTLAMTQPVDVARLPRRDGSVLFAERHESQRCD